ncbi:MAG: potassium channel protein [Arcobacter sp.]|nr:MAG: potassium channel protein [Arcobacter sp.]
MNNIVVSLSYKIESSRIYRNIKYFTYSILEDNSFKYKKYFDIFMIFLVLSTIGILIFEVNHQKQHIFDEFELIAILIFIIEWLGRFWVCSDVHNVIIEDFERANLTEKKYSLVQSLKKAITQKLDFLFSPMSIIDLLAILPYYRPLRVLRIFLLFRLFKILRYTSSVKQFGEIFKERKFEFLTLSMMYVMVVFFSSTIMYIYEGAGINDKVTSFLDAIYWSIITLSTVGYGDITPMTMEGKAVTLVLTISGFLVIAFGTSIVTTGLSDRMQVIKENRVESEVSKMTNFIVLCGYGIMGKILAEQLVKLKTKFVILDIDNENVLEARKNAYLCLKADATNIDVLKNVGVGDGATTVIALTSNDAVNLSIILSARTLDTTINIISRVNNVHSKPKLKIAGADHIISANDITSYVATEYVGQPVAFEAIDEILLNDDIGANVDEVEVLENSSFIGYSLDIIDFNKYNLTLIGIVNKEKKFIFNPVNQAYVISEKDIFIIIGYADDITELKIDLLNMKPKV